MNRFTKMLQTAELTEYERFALHALADQAEREAGHRLSDRELQAVVDDWLARPEQAQRRLTLRGGTLTRARRVRQQRAAQSGQDYHWQPATPARQLRGSRQKP